MQRDATHCNTMQHTATHCNTRCNTWSASPSKAAVTPPISIATIGSDEITKCLQRLKYEHVCDMTHSYETYEHVGDMTHSYEYVCDMTHMFSHFNECVCHMNVCVTPPTSIATIGGDDFHTHTHTRVCNDSTHEYVCDISPHSLSPIATIGGHTASERRSESAHRRHTERQIDRQTTWIDRQTYRRSVSASLRNQLNPYFNREIGIQSKVVWPRCALRNQLNPYFNKEIGIQLK